MRSWSSLIGKTRARAILRFEIIKRDAAVLRCYIAEIDNGQCVRASSDKRREKEEKKKK